MNSALAVAAVTAVLKNLLDNALIQHSTVVNMGDVHVSVLPPDRVPVGTEERPHLNLYLYRLTPNTRWQRSALFHDQAEGTTSSSLALDLHYLLTAYGERDFQAEVLLGHAIQFFTMTAVISQDMIRSSLQAIAVGPQLAAFSTSTLSEQVEQIKISPEFLSMEEMTKLWSSLQARSRVSVTYQVSTVMIENPRTEHVNSKERVGAKIS